LPVSLFKELHCAKSSNAGRCCLEGLGYEDAESALAVLDAAAANF
jgi:hypothetical protein